jgi:hypothetical protein
MFSGIIMILHLPLFGMFGYKKVWIDSMKDRDFFGE